MNNKDSKKILLQGTLRNNLCQFSTLITCFSSSNLYSNASYCLIAAQCSVLNNVVCNPCNLMSKKQVFSNSKVDNDAWHKRLGHRCFQALKLVCKELNITFGNKAKDFVCSNCLFGNHKQNNFSISLSKISAPLELIYSNV